MRTLARAALAFPLCLSACGQVRTVDGASEDAADAATDAASTAPPAPSVPAGSGASQDGGPAGTPTGPSCDVTMATERTFASADDLAVALHGLWVTCSPVPPPVLCPAGDEAMFFGAFDATRDPASRVAACGHLTSHGDSFVQNPQFLFTYEVTAAATGAGVVYTLHLWNASLDHRFTLAYGGDPQGWDASIRLAEGESSGALRSSGFTTY